MASKINKHTHRGIDAQPHLVNHKNQTNIYTYTYINQPKRWIMYTIISLGSSLKKFK